MAPDLRSVLELEPNCGSTQAALLVAQLHDMHRRLRDASRDLTPEELAWQPSAGVNTVGMLLAHIAIAEVHLTQIGVLGEREGHVAEVLRIGADADGMPMPPDGRPPATLADKHLVWFDGLLDRSLAYATRVARGLSDSDLERVIERPRPEGSRRVFNVRWALHHIVEHAAGHFGQILLVRHLRGKEPPRF
jgi:uncharacterized damage-inducible protein DinB